MSVSNSDRAAFRAQHRQQPSWMEPREDTGLLRIIVAGIGIAILVGIGLAFWARVAEAGIFVTMHGSDSGYDRITNWWTGNSSEQRAFDFNPFKTTVDLIGRAISDSTEP